MRVCARMRTLWAVVQQRGDRRAQAACHTGIDGQAKFAYGPPAVGPASEGLVGLVASFSREGP